MLGLVSFLKLTVNGFKTARKDLKLVVLCLKSKHACVIGCVRQLHSWQPGITNPYRGLVLWQVPESLDITVTLFKVGAEEHHLRWTTGGHAQANLSVGQQEPTAEEFEDKDWTFVIENVSFYWDSDVFSGRRIVLCVSTSVGAVAQETKGRRKVLASADVNMKKFASATPAQYDVTLKLKPLSVKVVEATLTLNLSCVFLKEGKAT